jgi:hypothetical protein
VSRVLRQIMYQLKRGYGTAGALYRITPGTTNLETGQKSITRVKYSIDRMVVLPFKFTSQGFYGSALLKAGREFSYGGFQEQDLKYVIVDGLDLPEGFEVLPEDYLIFEHKKFEIVNIEKLEDGLGYKLVANFLRGSIPNEVHEASIYQSIRLTQAAGVELVS